MATNNSILPAQFTTQHVDMSAQYGCKASLTVATFPVKGAMIRARRFYRADMPTTGKIELYTLEPRSEYAAHMVDANGVRIPTAVTFESWQGATEDFLSYADGVDSTTARRARHLLQMAITEIPSGIDSAMIEME